MKTKKAKAKRPKAKVKRKAKPKLSDKPSEMLLEALHDLLVMEKRPNVTIDMGSWYVPRDVGCEICLAGAAMAQRFDLRAKFEPDIWGDGDSYYELSPSDCGDSAGKKLHAIDDLREGRLYEALIELGIRIDLIPDGLPSTVPVSDYHTDRERFIGDMHYVAAVLEKHGL